MKSALISLVSGLTLFVNSAFASSYEYERLQKEVEPYLATKRPYPVPTQSEWASVPQDCKLVHINYLGRHGSRQVTTMGDVISDLINPATKLSLISGLSLQDLKPSDNPRLTPLGRILAERLVDLQRNYSNGTLLPGHLTQQGILEQEDLGRRLFDSTGLSPREVKRQISLRSVHAQSTTKSRTQDSRKAFIDGLASSLETRPESLKVTYATPTDQEVDRTLHFYDHCKNFLASKKIYKKASKQHIEQLESHPSYKEATKALARAFITPTDDADSANKEAVQISNLVYSMCQLDANMSYAMGICTLLFKTKAPFVDYLKEKNHFANVKQFYKRGPAPELNGINRNMTIDLLRDFITTTQTAIDSPNYPIATLRFAHDSTLLRMLLILDLATLNNSADANGKITWDVGKLAPMSANIAWQTFQCPSPFNKNESIYKVRMLHNEQVQNFPIGQCKEGDGFCDWNDVMEYYQQRTANLDLDNVCGELIIQSDSDD